MSARTHEITNTGVFDAASLRPGRRLPLVVLGALGVVYGDIGTSPLYAVKECFLAPHGVALTPENILGALSLIFWALIVIVSVKYVGFVMRADNRGEGGVLALMALALRRSDPARTRVRMAIVTMGLFGAALLYGDGMITPAISVLSAVEGLQIATPSIEHYVLPITVAILVLLFVVQSLGTKSIGSWFGPLVLAWFFLIAILGIYGITMHPGIVVALLPTHAAHFLFKNGWAGFVTLSAVFLAVTGAEALYADMGHFGRKPIRIGWFLVALPALLLNYFGQGALLLTVLEGGDAAATASTAGNPFFHLAPAWSRIPVVILATVATAIASQAVISGAFSLTRQAVQLGYLPRMNIRHTSSEEIGQIFVPGINVVLAILTIVLVLYFKSSTALAGAYGMAVSATMVMTTVLTFFVARRTWNWRRRWITIVLGSFLVVDIAFFGANLTKIAHGGWFPLVVGIVVFTLMATWRKGRDLLVQRLDARAFPVDMFIADVAKHPPVRVSGVSVFMTGSLTGTPVALLHNVKNNKVLHETVVLLSVQTEEVPYVDPLKRVSVEVLDQGFRRVTARYGFMDTPDVQEVLDLCKEKGHDWPISKTTFFLGRTTLIATPKPGMAVWRKKLFSAMGRNAERASLFFRIPPGRVVELGMQVEL